MRNAIVAAWEGLLIGCLVVVFLVVALAAALAAPLFLARWARDEIKIRRNFTRA